MLEPENIFAIIEAHNIETDMNDCEEVEAMFHQNFELYEAYAKLLDCVGMGYIKPPFD